MIDELFSLRGKSALITGGSSGIGEAIATALAGAGARVCLVARSPENLAAASTRLRERGAEVETVATDLADLDATLALPQRVVSSFGSPDVLVHAAGMNPRLAADEITPAAWQATLDLNLRAPFFVSRGFVPAMRERGYGRIITIASLQTQRAFVNGIPYGASKGGVGQLTRAMAQAWSPHGITCNAIAPGYFPTNLTAPLMSDPAEVTHLAAQTMIGRNGELRDLHGLAIFLASPASAYVTAQTIFVDGGWTGR